MNCHTNDTVEIINIAVQTLDDHLQGTNDFSGYFSCQKLNHIKKIVSFFLKSKITIKKVLI